MVLDNFSIQTNDQSMTTKFHSNTKTFTVTSTAQGNHGYGIWRAVFSNHGNVSCQHISTLLKVFQ